jgi:hypothetical protein
MSAVLAALFSALDRPSSEAALGSLATSTGCYAATHTTAVAPNFQSFFSLVPTRFVGFEVALA